MVTPDFENGSLAVLMQLSLHSLASRARNWRGAGACCFLSYQPEAEWAVNELGVKEAGSNSFQQGTTNEAHFAVQCQGQYPFT